MVGKDHLSGATGVGWVGKTPAIRDTNTTSRGVNTLFTYSVCVDNTYNP